MELILQLTDQATDNKYRIRIQPNPYLLSLGLIQMKMELSIYQCLLTMRQIIWPKSGPLHRFFRLVTELFELHEKWSEMKSKFCRHWCLFKYMLNWGLFFKLSLSPDYHGYSFFLHRSYNTDFEYFLSSVIWMVMNIDSSFTYS